MNDKTIVEVNGVKLEVDLRTAKRIDTMRVGSKVRVLAKSDYSDPKVYSGVVVGFEPFESLPTIIVCYLDISYAGCKLEFAYINEKSGKHFEIVPAVDDDLLVEKSEVLAQIDGEIQKKRDEIMDIERKRDYFLQHFSRYFRAQVGA